jgi:hypothetical protein
MTLKQLEARGWIFYQSYAQRDFAGGFMVVEYNKNDSPAKVAKQVTAVDNELTALTENASKFTTLKGILS